MDILNSVDFAEPLDPVLTLESRDVLRGRHSRDRGVLLVALTAAAMSIATTAYYFHKNELLGYQDSYSHLEIARRVLVSQTTGIAQLGGIWLPLPHLMQALFAWNWTLYRTGLAGSIVSGLCLVTGSVYIYRIILALSPGKRAAAFAGAMVFAANPNMLYQASTSMDELPLYAFTLMAVHGLVRWAVTKRAVHLLTASVGSLLAMLCRYEAWFLGGMYFLCVIVMAKQMGYRWREVRGLTLIIGSFGVFVPAAGWLLYNWMIFGNPLNFMFGADSSADQMSHFVGDAEKGNWPLTFKDYGITLSSDVGLFVLGAAVLSLVVFLLRERMSNRSMPILALCSVIPFYLYSLENGQEPLEVPTLNDALLNLRFGLIALLPCAILIGYLLSCIPRNWLRTCLSAGMIGAVAGICAMAVMTNNVVLPVEASQENYAQRYQAQAADYLVNHTNGMILINLVGNERVAFPVLNRVIYEGSKGPTGPLWPLALKNPSGEGIETIVMRDGGASGTDLVYDGLHNSPTLKGYRKVYTNADYEILVRQS